MDEIDSVLHEMRSLSVQASGEKTSPFERILLQKSIDGCISEIDRIATETECRASRLLGGPLPTPHHPMH